MEDAVGDIYNGGVPPTQDNFSILMMLNYLQGTDIEWVCYHLLKKYSDSTISPSKKTLWTQSPWLLMRELKSLLKRPTSPSLLWNPMSLALTMTAITICLRNAGRKAVVLKIKLLPGIKKPRRRRLLLWIRDHSKPTLQCLQWQ